MDRTETILIKRYANRKLYNTNESRYVTLEEIGQMVKSGQDVKILDHKSKKDITSVTLAQIIFEKEKKQKLLPSTALKDIIQSGGEAIQDFLQRRVNLGQLKEEAERTVERVEKVFGKLSHEEGASLLGELVRNSQSNLEDLQKRIDERIRTVFGPVTNFQLLRKEVDALRSQVDLIEEKMAHLEAMLNIEAGSEGHTPETTQDPENH